MKGMVFTEFLGMVADRFSENMVDDIIEDSDLPSGGAYTSVGLYDHSEIVKLVESLSHRTGAPAPDLVKAFGHHLFGRLQTMHPEFVCGIDDAQLTTKVVLECRAHRFNLSLTQQTVVNKDANGLFTNSARQKCRTNR